jgi:hypothetical protein
VYWYDLMVHVPPPFILAGEEILYTVKKVSDFAIPSRDVTNQTLSGGEYLKFPAWERENA